MAYSLSGRLIAFTLAFILVVSVATAAQTVNLLTRMYNPDGGFGSYGSAVTAHSRIRHSVLHSGSIRGLVYFNGGGGQTDEGFWVGERPGPSPYEVRAALIVNGQHYPLYYQGSRDAPLESGALVEMHLESPIQLHPGDEVVSITRYRFPAGSVLPRTTKMHWVSGQPYEDDAFLTSSEDVDYVDLPLDLWPSQAFFAPPQPNGWGTAVIGPAAALGTRKGTSIRPAVEVWGTSRAEDFPLHRGGFNVEASGIFGRALVELGMPYLSLHRGAARGWVDTTPEHSLYRRMLAHGSDVAILFHGVNDWHTGRTVAQFQEMVREFARAQRARGKWVLIATEYPNANSTDGFTTVEGQTPKSSESRRIAANDWIRGVISDADLLAAGGDPSIRREDSFDDYIEVADAIESSRNSGRFRPGTILTVVPVTTGSGTVTELAEGGLEVGRYHDHLAYVVEGTGAGQFRCIAGNDEDTLYLFEPWAVPLDETSRVALVESMVGYPSPNGLHASHVARALASVPVREKLQELLVRFPLHVQAFRPLGDASVREPLENLFHPDGKRALVMGRSTVTGVTPLGFRASFRGTDFRIQNRRLLLRASSPMGPTTLQVRHRLPNAKKWRIVGEIVLGPEPTDHEILFPSMGFGQILPSQLPVEIEAQIVEAPRNNRGLTLEVDFLRLVLDL